MASASGNIGRKPSIAALRHLIVLIVSRSVFFDIIYHNSMQSDWLRGRARCAMSSCTVSCCGFIFYSFFMFSLVPPLSLCLASLSLPCRLSVSRLSIFVLFNLAAARSISTSPLALCFILLLNPPPLPHSGPSSSRPTFLLLLSRAHFLPHPSSPPPCAPSLLLLCAFSLV